MRLFFYGTLLAQSGNPVAREAHARLTEGRRASACGRLFAIPDPAGWYPALVPGDGIVSGVVYETLPAFTATDLAALDAWEDCRPDGQGEYRRARISVMTEELSLSAEAYFYNVALPDGALHVAGGDFRSFVEANGLREFGANQPAASD